MRRPSPGDTWMDPTQITVIGSVVQAPRVGNTPKQLLPRTPVSFRPTLTLVSLHIAYENMCVLQGRELTQLQLTTPYTV